MASVDVLVSDTVEDMFEGNDLTQENDFGIDLDDLTQVSESTKDSSTSLKTKHKNKAKKQDKGYEKKVKIIKDKKIIIDTYHSNDTPGSTIRHAVTGVWLSARVGSIEENLYFKVRDNTGKDSRSLYYDSPEEYERHMFLILSTDIKGKWTEKFAETQKYLRSLEK
jgi:hypothetical protein